MTTSRVSLLTSEDLCGQLLDQSGGAAVDGFMQRKARRGLQQGLQEVNARQQWKCSRRRVIINTNTPYSTGTITYTNSTRTVTLASGTFPAWADQAWLLIANKSYLVRTRSSGTALILDETNSPGADLAAGTAYTLYQESYRLPYDCSNILQCWDTTSRFRLAGLAADLFDESKTAIYQAGTPQAFTVTGDDWIKGALCIKFVPVPAGSRQLCYFYDRTQPPLRIWKYNTGTVTVSAASAALTGTGTAFNATMLGAVIRFGSASTEPTSLEGSSPYLEERVILSVDSATTLTLDQAVDSAYTAVKYTISDLIDIEPTAMRTAVINCSALHFARERNADSTEIGRRDNAYITALKLAMEGDRRVVIEDYGFGSPNTGFPIAHTPTNAGYTA